MNGIRHIRRLAVVLASLAVALLALGATPAFAMIVPPMITGGSAPAPAVPPATTVTRTVLVGGMPGWQIVLIATGAAVIAAVAAVLVYRAWTTHGKPARTAA